jgi:hypothetical protein
LDLFFKPLDGELDRLLGDLDFLGDLDRLLGDLDGFRGGLFEEDFTGLGDRDWAGFLDTILVASLFVLAMFIYIFFFFIIFIFSILLYIYN